MKFPPPRLYWRMALYIGVAIAAFLVLGAAILFTVASKELENYVATRQSNLGQEAAAILSAGGQPALESWLRDDAAIPSDVTVFVLDRDHRDILERHVPQAYVDFIGKIAPDQAESVLSNYRPVRLTPQLIGPDGAIYVFLVVPSSVSVWGSPAIILGIFAAAMVVIGSVAWLIARAFGRPIGELQHASRELASGHIDARVPSAITERRDELGQLAADFNNMADRIAALIANRQRMMRELSHELRSPLARMQAAVGLATGRGALNDADRNRIDQEVGRMDRLIGDLLRYSHLDATPVMSRKLIRLEDVLQDLVADEEVEAREQNCRITFSFGRDLTVVGDDALLRSGLENIVRNAIRYTPPGAVVEISAQTEGKTVVIDVCDRGPGVPDTDLERIFDPFVRVPETGTADRTSLPQAHHGSGLGLAIARRVCQAHGGTITASPRTGGGLCIRIALPAAELT
ncbi:MAG: HAMP domain-containing protein [Rhodobacteraceae bacterium]|nr:HAMP domain-containing protein [Paracoccaceae bacterium]